MTQHIEPVAWKLEPVAWRWKFKNEAWPSGEPQAPSWAGSGTFDVDPLVRLSDVQAALAAAEERGRSEERERCAKIAIKQAPATQDFSDAPLQDLAKRIADAITKEPTP